jgi:hypothetical protein
MGRRDWRADEAQRRAMGPTNPARSWRVVVNGVPKGQHDEAGARAEVARIVAEEKVEIPLAYYNDPYGRITTVEVHLERWDGQVWVAVTGTSETVVIGVTLSGKGWRWALAPFAGAEQKLARTEQKLRVMVARTKLAEERQRAMAGSFSRPASSWLQQWKLRTATAQSESDREPGSRGVCLVRRLAAHAAAVPWGVPAACGARAGAHAGVATTNANANANANAGALPAYPDAVPCASGSR